MKFQIKIHRSYRNVIAICDSELLGKKFEEGKKQLDVKESFYKDQEIEREEMIKLMIRQRKEDASFNIVGPDSIDAAIEAGIINEEAIGKVQNVPFALVLL